MTDRGACGIVLAGGRSTRMGRDKASLPWGETTMLQVVVATLREALPHVIVVAARGQSLPAADAQIVRDPVPDEGPLRGLATGLDAARDAGFAWAFAAATDTPLLTAAVVRRLLAAAAEAGSGATGDDAPAAVLAVADGRDQPLIAAYRTDLAADASALLAQGRRGLRGLLDGRPVRRVDLGDDDYAANINTPADAARARGESADEERG